MLLRILVLILLAATAEVAVLYVLAREAGFFPTVAILIGAGLLGAVLVRRQGFRAWAAVRSDIAAGRPPTASVVDGVLVLVAGLLLAFPGLLTDVFGILLVIPGIRAALRPVALAWFASRVSLRFRSFASRASGRGEVIDAEFRRADAPAIDDRTPR